MESQVAGNVYFLTLAFILITCKFPMDEYGTPYGGDAYFREKYNTLQSQVKSDLVVSIFICEKDCFRSWAGGQQISFDERGALIKDGRAF